MSSILVVGCGETGLRVARAERDHGRPVTVLVRSDARARQLAGDGWHVVRADLDDRTTVDAMKLDDTVVYYFVPPQSSGTSDQRLKNFLDSVDAGHPPRRFVLISTTGVYGNCNGEWVDETRAPQPQNDRSRRRLAAERQLGEWAAIHGVEYVILRVAGIYGPNRLPRERLKQPLPVVLAAQATWSNRIHIDDLAQACLCAARRGRSGQVYNASDGHPTTMTDYFIRVARRLNLEEPRQLPLADVLADAGPHLRDFLLENRRVDNHKMVHELGVQLRYPDLDSGLEDVHV